MHVTYSNGKLEDLWEGFQIAVVYTCAKFLPTYRNVEFWAKEFVLDYKNYSRKAYFK